MYYHYGKALDRRLAVDRPVRSIKSMVAGGRRRRRVVHRRRRMRGRGFFGDILKGLKYVGKKAVNVGGTLASALALKRLTGGRRRRYRRHRGGMLSSRRHDYVY